MPRRREPECQAAQNRDHHGEGERLRIEARLLEPGQAAPRHQDERQIDAPDRDEHAGRAAEHAEEHAFGHELANQTPPARAQRGTHGNFPLAGGGARQQEVRNVHAGNEEDEADRTEEQREESPHLLNDPFVQRLDPNARASLGRQRLGNPRGDVLDVRLCELERGVASDASHDLEHRVVAIPGFEHRRTPRDPAAASPGRPESGRGRGER